MKALLQSIYDQRDAAAVHAQFERVVDALSEKVPTGAEHLEQARKDVLGSTRSPRKSGARSGPTTKASTARSEPDGRRGQLLVPSDHPASLAPPS